MRSSYPREHVNIFSTHTCVSQSQQQVLLLTSKASHQSLLHTAGITLGKSHLVWNVHLFKSLQKALGLGVNKNIPVQAAIKVWQTGFLPGHEQCHCCPLRRCFLSANAHKGWVACGFFSDQNVKGLLIPECQSPIKDITAFLRTENGTVMPSSRKRSVYFVSKRQVKIGRLPALMLWSEVQGKAKTQR